MFDITNKTLSTIQKVALKCQEWCLMRMGSIQLKTQVGIKRTIKQDLYN